MITFKRFLPLLMFVGLLDEPVAGLLLDDAHGAAEVLPDAVGNRGRRGGFQHSGETRARISAAVNKRKAETLMNKVANTSLQVNSDISEKAFGSIAVDKHDCMWKCSRRHLMVDGAPIVMVGDERRTNLNDVNVGVASHVRAQAAGVCAWLEAGKPNHTIHTNIFDDASMWMQRPPGLLENKTNAILKKRKSRKGKNVHLPCLNLLERMTFLSSVTNLPMAAELVSPAKPMPQANFATVRKTWKSWSVFDSYGSG